MRCLKSDGRSKLLSGCLLYRADWVSLSLSCPFRLRGSESPDASLGAECYIIPVLLLLLFIASLLNSSQMIFFFFLSHMSSASGIVLTLEPSKETERKEGGRAGRKKERKRLGCVCEAAKAE